MTQHAATLQKCLMLVLLMLLDSQAYISRSNCRFYSSCTIESSLMCTSGTAEAGAVLKSPDTIAAMMVDVAKGIEAAKEKSVSLALVDIPLPVTGGTELDDWPGGIKQKYSVLYPMLKETMKALNFSAAQINTRDYLGGEQGEDDAVGIWSNPESGVTICCFPTPDSIADIKKYQRWGDPGSSIFIIVNQQFFLDPLSKDESKEFLASADVAYQLESLNMRGPGALPVRGILYRQFPFPFKAARRLDKGGYVTLNCYEKKPPRAVLEELFFEDSKERDKNLGMLERLRRQIPNFGN